MKNVKKLSWGLLALCLAFSMSFIGCKKPTDGDSQTPKDESDPITNTDNGNTDPAVNPTDDKDVTSIVDGAEVTIKAGETIKVKADNKIDYEADLPEGVTVEKKDGIFTIKVAEDVADGQFNLILFADENDDGINVTVKITNPIYYMLTIALDDELAAKAAGVSVAYGNSDTVIETIDAIYTAGEKTAIAKLKKENADEWDWFSPVKVTVKDSNGEEIVIAQSVSYFCYSASEGNGYLENRTIKAVMGATELKFTVTFEGFTAKEISGIVYTKVENDFDTTGENAKSAVATVAEDGKSATFIVEKAYTNDSGWFQVKFADVVAKDADGKEVTITNKDNAWFEYKEGMNGKLSYVAISTDDYKETLLSDVALPTDTSSSSVVLLKSDLSIPEDAKAFKLVYTAGENDIVGNSSWISIYSDTAWSNETKLVNAWVDGFDADAKTFTVYITDSVAVTAFKASNFYIAADSAAYTGKITITYAK